MELGSWGVMCWPSGLAFCEVPAHLPTCQQGKLGVSSWTSVRRSVASPRGQPPEGDVNPVGGSFVVDGGVVR